MKPSLLISLGVLAFVQANAAAAAITYNVNQNIGNGSVVGTITTDGVIGSIQPSDIVAYNLLLTGAGGATYSLTNANSAFYEQGADVTASATGIFYNYSASDAGDFLVQAVLDSGQHYWCNAADENSRCAEGASLVPQSSSDPSAQFEARTGTRAIATAAPGAVPEPATWAMMLLGFGAIGIATGRKRTRTLAPA